jgi:uncharacterized protein YbbC (DUF1343 family)
MGHVATGLDRAVCDPAVIGDRRWALLANQAAVTADLEPARTALQLSVRGPLVLLFAPEHGLDGVAQDMEAVDHGVDPVTGLSVRSLYGSDASTLRPRPEDLEGVEVIVVDLPDIGSRYYTFAATMEAMMVACEAVGIEIVVLDRPNPIGGDLREGGPVTAGCESFVSRMPTPVRHGLTIGELALLLQRERYPSLELTVVACRGWSRSDWWDQTGLPWVAPSPNMPTLETAALYPGLCLFEATTLSEGRGTARPFHLVGAPGVAAERLTHHIRGLRIPGVAFRSATFRPEFGKHFGEVCRGVELHVVDRRALRPVELGVRLLRAFRELEPEQFGWRSDAYEFVTDVPALDLLTGSPDARRTIEEGGALEPMLASWQSYVREFEARLEGIVIYHEE